MLLINYIIVEKAQLDIIHQLMNQEEVEAPETKGSLITQILKCLDEEDESKIEEIAKGFMEIPLEKDY